MKYIEDEGPAGRDAVRNAIFGYLEANNVPADIAIEALCHCVEAIRDAHRLGAIAAEIGVHVKGPLSNEHMALYWEISRDGRPMGFIYRGWNDPGFGIGECLQIPAQDMPLLMAQWSRTTSFLASNGVVHTKTTMPDGGCWLNMTTPIYADGFSAGTLKAALTTMTECVEMVRSLVA